MTSPSDAQFRMVRHAICFALLVPLLAGCNLPGRPKPGPEVPRPTDVMAFDQLYGQNCAGCHGITGQNGAAINLANPEYQAYIDDASLTDAISKGEKGALMPAFEISHGGNLTTAQVAAIVHGMRERWNRPNQLAGVAMPAYLPIEPGNAGNGATVYAAACARCHGINAAQPGPSGSILDGAFLALINERTVRSTIVAGRPDIGQPDWRNMIPGRPMTEAEIGDVSAWLIAQTPQYPGRPYPVAHQPASEKAGEAQPSAVQAPR